MADDKNLTVASPVKVAEEKEVVDGVEVGTTTPAKSPVKVAKDCTDSTEVEAPTNGAPEKVEDSKDDDETPNGDSNVDTAEPVVCPVKRKSAVVKEGEKEEDSAITPEKKAKKDEETTEVEKEAVSA